MDIQAYLAGKHKLGNWVSYVRTSDDKREVLVGSDPPGDTDGMVLS
ncbi:hypothetical protein [Haladaptatus cibarius]|nr:hypothetical protein [Haladaptatus cibarius]